MTRRSSLSRLFHSLGLLLGGGLFLWQIIVVVTTIVDNRLVFEEPMSLFVGTILILIATIFQIGAWRTIMADLDAPLSWGMAVRAFMLPFVARYIPGMVWGYLSRSQWLEERHGTPASTTNLGAVVEAVSLVTAASLVALSAGAWRRDSLLLGVGASGCGLVVAGFLGLHWLLNQSWPLTRWLDRFGGQRLLRQLTPWRVSRAVPWHLALWLGYGTGIWVMLGMVADRRTMDPALVIAAYALAWLMGFLVVFLPAGMGLREWGLTFWLGHTIQLEPGLGSAMALLMRGQLIVAEALFILIALMIGERRGPASSGSAQNQKIEPPGPEA